MSAENSPARQQELTLEDVQRRVEAVELRLRSMEAAALDHQSLQEKFSGQSLRIERMTHTIDDLLRRFEAWKTVGNAMGDDVKDLTIDIRRIDTIVATQTKLLGGLSTLATEVKEAMEVTQTMLKTMLAERQ